MTQVTVLDWNISRIIDVVHELRAKGLVQGRDFDFAYQPAEYDNFGGGAVRTRSTVFTFYTESMATWFAIAYV